MNALVSWLDKHNISNPHLVEREFPHLKPEFDLLFGNYDIQWPQPGGQELFANCTADIAIYGGEAGGGKSWSLVFEHSKWIHIKSYAGVIVRKLFSQIFGPGGLWSIAKETYLQHGGHFVKGDQPRTSFPSESEIYFKHSQHSSDIEKNWQGLQSPLICIDELTQFTKEEFLYIMSRNRSTTGINSYIRATCNPDPLSFVREMIKWWIGEDGYIIEDRCGVIRYFLHRDDKFHWAGTKEELIEQFGKKSKPKSFTFIQGKLEDNLKMLEADPEYEASMENLTQAMVHALRGGNWNELDNPDALFSRSNLNANRIKHISLDKIRRIIVAVDPAGSTNANSDDTGIVVVGLGHDGRGYVLRDETGKYTPSEWAKITCDLYHEYLADKVVAEKNFGGEMVAHTISTYDKTVIPKLVTASKGKAIRAEPISSLYSQGMISHVGHELKQLENQMCSWKPGDDSPNNLDAMVWGFTELFPGKRGRRPARIHGMDA